MSLRLFGLGVAAYAVVWVYAALTLPERVPVHFGVTGQATTYAGRGIVLVGFALLGLVTAAVLWWADRVLRRGSMTLVNVPHWDWWTQTPERERRVRSMLRDDAGWMSAATMALMVVLLASTVSAARLAEPRLGLVFGTCLAAYLVGVVVFIVRMYGRRYHPDHQGDL